MITEAHHWASARDQHFFRPPELETLGYVPCCTAEEVERGFLRLHPLRLVLEIDESALTSPVEPASPAPRILGPIDRAAVVAATPLRPRTPDGHTLYGVLTKLHLGERDPELARKLDEAFAQEISLVRSWVKGELRRYPEPELEELVQEVLTESWAKLPNYVPSARFRAYLKQIALNKCANVRRNKRDALTEDGELDPVSDEPDALRKLEDKERNRMVEEAAREVLAPLDQEIVQLRYVYDYPLEDIATRLQSTLGDGEARDGVPRDANAVRVALQRSRRRLMVEIARRMGESPS